jgi:hypothetical protein
VLADIEGKREDLKAKIEELETNRKMKNRQLYRGTNNFKKDYQPGTNMVKDEKGDRVAECHSIFVRWRNYFSQVLNTHGVNDIRQTKIHTAEPLETESSAFESELVISKIKSYKLPGIDQIPAELFKADGLNNSI